MEFVTISKKMGTRTAVTRKRRVFIRSKGKVFKIFSFAQERDGSIYSFSPDFADAKWLSIQNTEEGPQLIGVEAIGEGKVSLHGSGIVSIRPNDDPKGHKLRVNGNYLKDDKKKAIGLRHLFTVLMKKPKHQPETSQLVNRPSDYCIEANEVLKPTILVFFAVPQKGVTVNFEFSISMDDLVNGPNDFRGFGLFGLRYHDVIWFAYRTRYMEAWPKQAHICYLDGFTFPIFVGIAPGIFRLEYRQPEYSLDDNKLTIECHQVYQRFHPYTQIEYCCEGK